MEDGTSLSETPTCVRVTLPIDGEEHDCALRSALDRIGDKWSILLVVLLGRGTARYSELQRAVPGISQRMLTLTLRNLERDGLVRRTVYPEVPPRVEYDLTELGASLMVPVSALAEWLGENGGAVLAARLAYDLERGEP